MLKLCFLFEKGYFFDVFFFLKILSQDEKKLHKFYMRMIKCHIYVNEWFVNDCVNVRKNSDLHFYHIHF